MIGSSLMRDPVDPRQNPLLAALPEDEYARLLPHLDRVSMRLGHVICEPGIPTCHVYFPATVIVSLLYVFEDGQPAEIAVAGNKGVAGIHLFMGGETTTSWAVLQFVGDGYRQDAQLLKDEFHRAGPLRSLLLRYTEARLTKVAQTALCNRHHSLHQ